MLKKIEHAEVFERLEMVEKLEIEELCQNLMLGDLLAAQEASHPVLFLPFSFYHSTPSTIH